MNMPGTSKKRFVIIVAAVFLFLFLVFSILGFATQQVVLLLASPNHRTVQTEFNSAARTDAMTEMPLEEPFIKTTYTVRRGDTFIDLLRGQDVETDDAYAVLSAVRKAYNPRDLRPGQEITLLYDRQSHNQQQVNFRGIMFHVDERSAIVILRNDRNEYDINTVQRQVVTQYARSNGMIETSLYEAALQSGLPPEVLMDMTHLFSFDVDFQRDIRPNDRFEVVYERHFNDHGEVIREGPILYASLTVNNDVLRVYRHVTGNGEADYFDEQGQTVRKTLLKTPIDGARLTSRYGMRRHPVMGYSKMHRGLDFAAPRGTPIMASGDGTIVYAGGKGTYGKFILIRHANRYSTAYAHLSAYSRGVKKGKRIRQGEIIGYVGATGMATGPHLHYEVRRDGRQINPAKVKFPPGRVLSGTERERFMATKSDLDRVFVDLGRGMFIARSR
jgi:murein DD-endopeptidase MepM/ murein hydrolase activator NlpD